MTGHRYDAFVAGIRVYANLQIIWRTDDGDPMLGWPNGGFLDPLDVKRGKWHIVNAWGDTPI